MLAIAVALQLLAAGQTKLEDPPQDAAPPAATSPDAPQPAPDRPPGTQEAPPAAPAQEGAPPPRPAPAAPAAKPPEPRAPQAPPLLSLLSAETLHGGSMATAWAGWPAFGVMYGQGLTEQDDLGGMVQYAWATTELTFGAWYRRALGRAGPFLVSGRLALNWYSNEEGTLIYSDNEANHGLQLVPSLLLSTRGAGGIFSISGDLPMTITLRGDGGFLFQPRVTGAYETQIYDQLSLGLRAGLGYRVGAGSAPLADGMADLELSLVASYRIF
jgi:hypothetical protein